MKFKIVTECLFDIKEWYNFPLMKQVQAVVFEHCRLIISYISNSEPPCL